VWCLPEDIKEHLKENYFIAFSNTIFECSSHTQTTLFLFFILVIVSFRFTVNFCNETCTYFLFIIFLPPLHICPRNMNCDEWYQMDCAYLYQGVPWLWQKGGSWPSMKKPIGHIFGAVITCCKALTAVNEENLLERFREKSIAWSYCGTCGLQQNQSMSKQTVAYCSKNISDQCGSQRRLCKSSVGNFLYMETEWAYFGETTGKIYLWFKSC